jgi:hypothetical protein
MTFNATAIATTVHLHASDYAARTVGGARKYATVAQVEEGLSHGGSPNTPRGKRFLLSPEWPMLTCSTWPCSVATGRET